MTDFDLSRWKPRDPYRIWVRRYTRPEKVGSLYIPESYNEDGTLSLWESIPGTLRGCKADEAFGTSLDGFWIFRTRTGFEITEHAPIDVYSTDDLFLLDVREIDAAYLIDPLDEAEDSQ